MVVRQWQMAQVDRTPGIEWIRIRETKTWIGKRDCETKRSCVVFKYRGDGRYKIKKETLTTSKDP
jgi:hypothetical protein